MPRKKKTTLKDRLSSIDPVAARKVGGAALFVGVCVGIGIGLTLLATRVQERSRQSLQASPVVFDFAWPQGVEGESWLPEAFRADLRHLASLHMGQNDPLSPAPLARLGKALEASGWFDDRPLIERQPGGRIYIAGAWRVPVAAVRVQGNDLPVSRHGKIMPIPYEVGQSDMPVVFGMQGLPPLNRDGSLNYALAWDAKDLAAGLELLDLLRAQEFFGRVVGIDVSEFGPSRCLTIVFDSGARVRWGGPVAEFNPAEISTDLKVVRLKALLADDDRPLDDPTMVLDLFHETGVYRIVPPLQGE